MYPGWKVAMISGGLSEAVTAWVTDRCNLKQMLPLKSDYRHDKMGYFAVLIWGS